MMFHDKLRKLLGDRRWTHRDLADAIGGVSKTSVANWLNGSAKPGLDSAVKIARSLEVPLSWLADDQLDFPPPPEGSVQSDGHILDEDEENVIRFYRNLKRLNKIDDYHAIGALLNASHRYVATTQRDEVYGDLLKFAAATATKDWPKLDKKDIKHVDNKIYVEVPIDVRRLHGGLDSADLSEYPKLVQFRFKDGHVYEMDPEEAMGLFKEEYIRFKDTGMNDHDAFDRWVEMLSRMENGVPRPEQLP